jgi:predicted nucleotidyltransferase
MYQVTTTELRILQVVKNMRLKAVEIQTIEKAVHTFDPHAVIYLFGSRVDDRQKGGDIDLLVLSSSLTYRDKLKIKQQLFEHLEEQKIDLVIAKDTHDPFVRIALERGVRLE